MEVDAQLIINGRIRDDVVIIIPVDVPCEDICCVRACWVPSSEMKTNLRIITDYIEGCSIALSVRVRSR